MDLTNSPRFQKKMKRLENKKRKLQAFLELVQSNEEDKGNRPKLRKVDEAHISHKKAKKHHDSQKEFEDFNGLKKTTKSFAHQLNNSAKMTVSGMIQDGRSLSQCGYSELKHMKKEVIKMKTPWPQIELTEIGTRSLLTSEDDVRTPLFIKDIQTTLLNLLVPGVFPMPARWARIIRKRMISHVVTVLVGGVTINDFKKCLGKKKKNCKKKKQTNKKSSYIDNHSSNRYREASFGDPYYLGLPPPDWLSHALPRTSSLMSFSFEMSSSYASTVWEELLCVTDGTVPWNCFMNGCDAQTTTESRVQYDQACQSVAALVANNGEPKEDVAGAKNIDIHPSDRFDRRQLLLNPSDLYMLKFPVPFLPWCKENGFVFSKEKYDEVKPTSPMFAIDCEMCMTTSDRLELTSISVVNEKLKLVYHKLVKPENEITDYLTRFSGITKNILENVTTTLHDVHRDLHKLLPSDAIIVGHSLDSDLKAMKMMHPYVIDTAAVYNLNYIKNKPSALRILTKLFLDKDIQMDPGGHDPTEDAIAALELVQLKLKRDISYGNVLKGFQLGNFDINKNQSDLLSPNGNPESSSPPEEYFNIFQHAAKSRVKTAILMTPNSAKDCKEILDSVPREKVEVHVLAGNKALSEKAAEISMAKDFTYLQMKVKLKGCKSKKNRLVEFEKLDKKLRRIFQGTCQKAMLMYIFAGSEKNTSFTKCQNGMVMCCIKGLEEIS